MKKLHCIVIRQESAETPTQAQEERIPYEKAANALMNASGYIEYVSKHGYHFTPKLAEYVCMEMVNADKTTHNWDARSILNLLGNSCPQGVTLGDMVYLANMAYADFYPNILQTESRCIDYAKAVATDIDGYEGMPFCRWTADAIGKGTKVDWASFL